MVICQICLSLTGTVALSTVLLAPLPARADDGAVVLPPANTSADARDIASRIILAAPLGSTIRFFDGAASRQITTVHIPTNNPLDLANPRARQNILRPQLTELGPFLKADSSGALPSEPGRPSDDIQPVRFFEQLGSSILTGTPAQPYKVLLVGSAKNHTASEPDFSMAGARVPNDAHLSAPLGHTPYSTVGRAHALAGVQVHWCWNARDWANDLHRQATAHFWSAYLRSEGAVLATFTNDKAACIDRFLKGIVDMVEPPSIGPSGTEPLMVEYVRGVAEVSKPADSAHRAVSAQASGPSLFGSNVRVRTTPPARTHGPARVGIRWTGACDLDLWARATEISHWVFFNHRVDDGLIYNFDFQTAPGAGNEEYLDATDIDIDRSQIRLNYFRGTCQRPDVTLRVAFDGGVFERTFTFPVDHGNQAADVTLGDHAFWIDVPLAEVFRRSRTSAAPTLNTRIAR